MHEIIPSGLRTSCRSGSYTRLCIKVLVLRIKVLFFVILYTAVIQYRGLFMMLNNKQKCVKIQKREKKHHEKAAMQALRGPGELARRLEKETGGQPQRFLNKNKNTLNYYLSLFTYSLVTYLHI